MVVFFWGSAGARCRGGGVGFGGFLLGGASVLCSGGSEPVGVGAGVDDVGVEGESVDDGRGQARVGEGGAPFAEGGVGGARDRGAFFAFGDDLEQQFCPSGIQADVSDFIEAYQVQPRVAADDPGQLLIVGGFDELVH